jgi:hypothetical protein
VLQDYGTTPNAVELVSFYAKNSVRFRSPEALRKVIEACTGRGQSEDTPRHRRHAIRKQLSREQIDTLVTGYQAGISSPQLAGQYGIERHSVSRILGEEGVVLREDVCLTAKQQEEIARLYVVEQLSIAKVAARLGLSLSPVRGVLATQGVKLRGRHERPNRQHS